MWNHQTRPQHFLLPTIQVILGGLFAHIKTWEWVGWLIVAVAAGTTFFLIYSAVKKHQLELIEEEHRHLVEITKIDTGLKTTHLIIDKTDLTGYMQQTFNKLDIAPGKIKKFAQGVLIEGQKMTIREWTPLKKGKLFSDPEWRKLIAFLKQPDWDDKHIKFIVPINPNNENDGYELTAAGKRWLKQFLEPVLVGNGSPA